MSDARKPMLRDYHNYALIIEPALLISVANLAAAPLVSNC
jgi:hypothetical protein